MMAQRPIRIGTRSSLLALYQATLVQQQLNHRGVSTEVVEIASDGDADLTTPLYELGIQGIFTRSLDAALLDNRIDLAVHSTKDIPTRPAAGLVLSGVLVRGSPFDCLVLPKNTGGQQLPSAGVIATCSLRRRLQWLYRYPNYRVENIRGNVQTRLAKLDDSSWQGAIFAAAALERLQINTHPFVVLNWMLPSPAQGAIGLVCRENDEEVLALCRTINHPETEICITAERDFLSALHGGCAVPIAAYARMQHGNIFFRGNIMSLDAKQKAEVALVAKSSQAGQIGKQAAEELLLKGAEAIVKTFRPV